MKRKVRYRYLMMQIRQAHKEFSNVWETTRAEELRKRNLDIEHLSNDPLSPKWSLVFEANGVAYQTASRKAERKYNLLDLLFNELPFEAFLQGNTDAIDAFLDFVEIDVLAFRCGYLKQWTFHQLKRLEINSQQKKRLSRLLVNLCKERGQGPERRYLTRLMIKHASRSLIEELAKLAANSDEYTQRRTERVITVLLNSRHDLK